MIFNSLTFVIFLFLSVIIYWMLTIRSRPMFLFIGSLVFYGFWRIDFIPVMMLSTIVDYFVARELGKPQSPDRRRKQLLWLSIIVNLGLLVYFKYLFFFAENVISLAHLFGIQLQSPTWNIILPLGISFYTFQTLSYTIDVYRRHYTPIPNFGLYACYVTFFPQLVAGPVLRASEVVGQLISPKQFKVTMLQEGLKRIIYGLFLKVVLADNIAPLVDTGFRIEAGAMGGLDVWTLAFLFGLQIYFDFAGYSHIAIGCAKLMGIEFPENFNFPYAAKSFKDFWKRWHISLSSWIRDYLYLPLAGVQVLRRESGSEGGLTPELTGTTRKMSKTQALFMTWAIMGLWHGANWTFVFWGLYHATLVYIERLVQRIWKRMNVKWNPRLGWAVTLAIAMLGWIPFRAQDIGDTMVMFGKVLNPMSYTFLSMRENVYLVTGLLTLGVILAYEIDRLHRKWQWDKSLIFVPANTLKYTVMLILICIFFRPINQFIYFQF